MSLKGIFNKVGTHVSGWFLLLIVGWLVIEPLTLSWPVFNMVFLYLLSFFVLGGLYLVTGHRRIVMVCLCLTLLNLVMEMLTLFIDSHAWQVCAFLSGAGADVLITVSILWHTAFKSMYTRDDVFAGVIGFVLITLCFADMYLILQQFDPGAIHFGRDPGSALPLCSGPVTAGHLLLTTSDFLYFSFMTITTVGYGDVIPISHVARRLTSIEASTGVLYVAMFVGRLMGLYMWSLHQGRDAGAATVSRHLTTDSFTEKER